MSTLTQRYRPLKRFSFGDKNNLVIRLILVNLIIFAALFLVKMIYMVTTAKHGIHESQLLSWAIVSADPKQLITHPWTLFTYMFVHTDFWLLLSCMVWLWGYGTLIQGMYGSRMILPLYLLGGLAGAVTFFAAYQLIPGLIVLKGSTTTIGIGASASVMAIVACTTLLIPKYRLFPMLGGGIPLYVISIVYILFCFLGRGGDTLYGYLAANAGGLVLGLFFGYRIKEGYDPGAFLNRFIYKFSHFFEPKDTPYAYEHKNIEGIKPYKQLEISSEDQIDELLDKINQNGYDSLSAEEKELLMKASREDKN